MNSDAGCELTESMSEREMQRQFEADREIVRALNRNLIHRVGRLELLSGRSPVRRSALAWMVPATGQLTVGYTHRLGLGVLDSSQTMRLELSTGRDGNPAGSHTARSSSDSKTGQTSHPEVSAS